MNSYQLSHTVIQNNRYPCNGIYNPNLIIPTSNTKLNMVEALTSLIPNDQIQQMEAASTEQIIQPFNSGFGQTSHNHLTLTREALSNLRLKIRAADFERLLYCKIQLEIGGSRVNGMNFLTNLIITSMLGLQIMHDEDHLLIPLAFDRMLFDKYIPIFMYHTIRITVSDNAVLPQMVLEATHHMCSNDLATVPYGSITWNAFECQEMMFTASLINGIIQKDVTFNYIVPYMIILVKDFPTSTNLTKIELSLNGATPYVLSGSDIHDLGFMFSHKAFALSFSPETWDNPTQLFNRTLTTGHGINFSHFEPSLKLEFDISDGEYDFVIIGINHQTYRCYHGMVGAMFSS
jgi:hypothetical protein